MIADILLVEPKNLSIITENLNFYFFELIGLFVVIALIFELMSDGDGLGVLKRALSGLLIISIAAIVQSTLTTHAFKLADKGYSEVTGGRPTFFAGENSTTLFSEYKRQIRNHEKTNEDGTKREGVWNAIKDYARYAGSIVISPAGSLIDSSFVYTTRIVIIFVFLFLKVSYTAIFIMNLFLLPFPALVSILPFTKNSSTVPISALLWLMIQPFTVMSILFCMDIMLADSILSSTKLGYGMDFETCIMILCFSVILIASTGITVGIINGTGITQAVAQSSQIVPLKAMMAGKLALAAGTKGASLATSFLGGGKLMNLGANMAQISSNKLSQGSSEGLRGGVLKGINFAGRASERVGRGFYNTANSLKDRKSKITDIADLERNSYGDKHLGGSDPNLRAYGLSPHSGSMVSSPRREMSSETPSYSDALTGRSQKNTNALSILSQPISQPRSNPTPALPPTSISSNKESTNTAIETSPEKSSDNSQGKVSNKAVKSMKNKQQNHAINQPTINKNDSGESQ